MAYAALISLARTIYRLLNSSHISVLPDPSQLITVFHDHELEPLHEILQSLDSSRIRSQRLSTLDVEIREAAYKLEDAIETLVSNQLLSHQSQDNPPFSISIDLDQLKKDLDSFTLAVKKMKEEYIEELSSASQKVNDDAADPSTGGKKSKMVGFSGLFREVKDELTDWYKPTRTVALSGMAGIGKTSLAREIFEDPEIEDYFESLIWVRVGPEYQLKGILRQVSPEAYEMISEEEGDEDELAMLCLYEILQDKRSLIVLDDIWESKVFEDLKKLVPNYSRSRVLITSTIQDVAESCANVGNHFRIPLLNKEESWRLLRDTVFGDEQESSCPFALERAGKKIAEKCDGLPLLIVTVAGILSKAEKTVEYWNEVAEKQNSVFTDAYEHVCEFLLPSYRYLPQRVEACFLYMGILPQDSEISRSNLINLWRAEGFLGPNHCANLELFATECLAELESRNVVIVRQKVGVQPSVNYKTKKYHLHSTFLHLCVKEAVKNKFYYVLNRFAEDAEQSMKGQRRLCIQNNVLFGIEEFYNSMSSISDARSLLCTGSFHQYPVPICSGMRFLRVLDSLTIRFYEFPIEVLELIMLRYLAMTYDGELPTSLSKLWNLESLIVNRHISLKSPGAPSYLPMEIWNMKELKHLQVTGSDLPDPCETSLLPNLLTLLGVTSHSCTQRVLDRIPFLETLGIQTEFLTGLKTGAAEPMCYFDQIPHMGRLKTLAVIVNPILMAEVVAPPPPPPPPRSIMYPSLGKLSLSGLGYQWEHMRMIALLPNLQMLKLRCNAFRGPEWETPLDGFPSLTYLSIEDSDLVVWTLVGEDSFWNLKRLSLKDCYQLEEIPERLEKSLNKIEVIDCSPSAVSWAKQRKDVCDVYVHSSWE